MKLYYLRGALGDKELLTRHEEAIWQLLTGVYHGSNLEKLHNQEVYSFRLSIRERLLFTVEEIRGQRCLIVLDYLPTHNYKDSRFLQAGVLKKYKARHVKAYEELIQQEEGVVLTEQAGEVKADISALDYYQNQWIALNVEQQQAIEVALPAVCSGVAGSGKSCVALSLIVNEALKPAEPESLPVVYVTRSSRLVEVMKDAYHQLPVAQSSGRCVQFKTFNELVAEDSGVAEEVFVDAHYFKVWYDEWQRHQKKVGRVKKEAVLSLDAVSAYRECRIASGYSMEAYSALSDTSSCLAKGDGSRARLYEVYERYGQYLASVNKIDPCFYSFKTRHRFYRVFFDEAQDGSLCQLKEILLLAAEQGVIFLMDGHQRLYDHYSARQFLFQPGLVPEQNHIELTLSFRSPLRIMSVANEVIALKQVLAGGLSDKYEPGKIRGALEGKGLGWVSILSQEQTGRDPWLQTHSDKPYFAIVTRSEFFEEAKRLFPRSVLILTPQEIKGLEYDIVVTYKLYDPRLFQLIQARLKEVGDKEQPIHRPKAGASDDRFSLFLNECYTSYMRGTQVLVICEPEARPDNPLLQKILPLTNQGERLSDACLVRETSGNWEEQVLEHARSGNIRLARSIFTEALHRRAEDFDAFVRPAVKETIPAIPVMQVPEPRIEYDTAEKSREKGKAPVASAPKQSAPSGSGLFSPAPKVKGLSQADQQAINPVDCFTDKRLLAMFKRLKKDFWTSASGHRIKDHLNTNQEAQTVFFACLVNHYELIDLAPLNVFLTYKPIQKNKKLLSRLQKLEDIFAECRQMSPESKMKRLKYNASIVHFAAYYNKPEWIQWLHSFGANLNLPDSEGRTPVFYAAQGGIVGVIRPLNTFGADINQSNNEGMSPLWLAAREGHDSMVRTLIASGANVNQSAKDGWTPLLIATKVGHYPVVCTLIESGANVNQSNKDGWTPVLVATKEGFVSVVRTLIESGANANQPDKDGWSPLYAAIRHRNEPMIRTLLELGANVNQPGPDDLPLIWTAAVTGDESIFRTLIEFGVNPDGFLPVIAEKLIKFGARSVEAQERIHKKLVSSGVQGNNDKCWLTPLELAEIRGIDVAKITGHNKAKKILSDSPDPSSDRTFFRVNVPLPAPSNKPTGSSFTS